MKYLATLFAALALALGGCSGDEKPADVGKTVKDAGEKTGDALKNAGETVKDAAKDAADAVEETLTFDCAKPGCSVTKEGTAAEPPS